jgi:hypothetical protein
MIPEEKIKYVSVGLRIIGIELHLELLKKIIKIIEIVDNKKGRSNIKDFLKIK